MYQESRDELELLSCAHKDEAPGWSRVPRRPNQDSTHPKLWNSVYHRHNTKIPTVRQLLVNLSREEGCVRANEVLGESEMTVTLEGYWSKAVEAENIW